jgi:hypothetical protein
MLAYSPLKIILRNTLASPLRAFSPVRLVRITGACQSDVAIEKINPVRQKEVIDQPDQLSISLSFTQSIDCKILNNKTNAIE